MDEQSKDSLGAEIKNANEVIKKLQNFANELVKTSDNNILTHLCDGLQTFLGYDKDSKGYDGSGIVYSDLDRLCDGVMGFLSGVLGAVKNENEVTTYDNYISGMQLKDVLKEVNKNIGSGSAGLAESVTRVKEWLEGYEGEVREKINAVKKPIENLKTLISDDTMQINAESVQEIPYQIAIWTQRSRQYITMIKQAEEAINYIDPKLKDKLTYAIDMLFQATRSFEAAAGNEDLEAVHTYAGNQLLEVSKEIEDMLNGKCVYLKKYLEFKINEIHTKLYNLRISQFESLQQCVDNDLQQAVDTVSGALANLIDKHKGEVVPDLSRILAAVSGIIKTVTEEKITLATQVKALGLKIGELRKVHKKIVVPPKLGTYEDVRNTEWYLQELEELKKRIITQMKTHVAAMFEGIQKKIDKITGSDGGEGLVNIVTAVKAYAIKFSTDEETTFKGIVEGFLAEILQNKSVTSSLLYYVNGGKTSPHSDPFRNGKSSVPEIAKLIGTHLKAERTSAIASFNSTLQSGGETDIEKHVAAAQAVCMAFADMLERKIIVDDGTSEIERAIKPLLKDSASQHMSESLLKMSVKYILNQLVVAAKQSGEELYTFVEESKMDKYVNAALGVATALQSDFKKAIAASYDSDAVPEFDDDGSLEHGVKNIATQVDSPSVKSQLGTVVHDAVNKGIRMLHAEVTKIVGQFIPHDNELKRLENTLEGVKIALAKMQTKIGYDYETSGARGASDLQKNATEIHQKIEQFLTTTIGATEQQGMYKDLAELHKSVTALGKTIEDVKKKVGLVGDRLDVCLKGTSEFANHVPKIIASLFKQLRDKVVEKITKGFHLVQARCVELYKERKKRDIEALREYAETQFGEIRSLIDANIASSTKGLLTLLKKKLSILDELNTETDKSKLTVACAAVKQHITDILSYIRNETYGPDHLRARLYQLPEHINNLLYDLSKYHFNSVFSENLEKLKICIDNMRPTSLSEPSNPLAEALKKGLMTFGGELGKAYVNVYSGQPLGDLMANKVVNDATSETITELTRDGRNCARVCVTSMSIIYANLNKLLRHCKDAWYRCRINKPSHFGNFLEKRGFVVSDKDKQNGELRDSSDMTGRQVFEKLTVSSGLFKSLEVNEDDGTLKQLVAHIETYNAVCHFTLHPAPRHPSSIYENLAWLTGLPFNAAYQDLLSEAVADLFDKPSKPDDDYDGIAVYDFSNLSLEAYPHAVTYNSVHGLIISVCSKSRDVLTSILGHGHSSGIYACEFADNSLKLHYPKDASSLICTLRSIVKSLYQQLIFLYHQCKHETNVGGWRDCHYGQGVGGSDWQCNTTLCANKACPQIGDQNGNQQGNQNGNQIARQTCDQHPKCGVKSPLQSFLEDGLPGFMPHLVSSKGPKMSCATCPKTTGMPCKLPMGFSEISVTASHIKLGGHIHDALDKFCGNPYAPLRQLYGLLNCLLPSAPQTLDDMFAFYYALLNDWGKNAEHRKTAFVSAVQSANFKNPETELDITAMFKSSTHKAGEQTPHLTGDLHSLVKCTGATSSDPSHPCGPYLHPICLEGCDILSSKHADKYLSWVTYITATFYKLLRELYEACNSKCGGDRPKCRFSKCVVACTANKLPMSLASNHDASCNSIVKCKHTRPTIYKYGFVHGNVATLADKTTKRTCQDFCMALNSILTSKTVNDVLTAIDNFLWIIRTPFAYLVLALWLLSLLYLLHIMVIRLDLLHIKSHLHSPSSHRIAAQSLLAAARVNKLGRVFYLQP